MRADGEADGHGSADDVGPGAVGSAAADRTSERRALADVALGRAPADLVITGGRIVEVHTGQVIEADIAIKGERIAAVGACEGIVGEFTETLDADGSFLTPGFIDCHMHAGESQLGMTELARLLLSRGTAAIGTCFYEAGIVAGYDGIRHSLEEARRSPLTVFLSPFVSSYRGFGEWGNPGRFNGQDLLRLLEEPECAEVREWSFGLEASADQAIGRFIDEARYQGKVIAGHLAGLEVPELQASAALGVSSDHETVTAEGAIERARLGIRVQIRQGSYSWDLEPLVRAITEDGIDPRFFMFCTDGVEADELGTLGHIEHLIRLAVQGGLSPVSAIQMATINAAEYFRATDHLGSLAPGRSAHVNVIEDLVDFRVRDVVALGSVVVREGAYVGERPPPSYPAAFRRSVDLGREPTAADFAIRTSAEGPAQVRVIVAQERSIATEEAIEEVTARNGVLEIEPGSGLAKICVLDRHEGSGRIGRGLVRGFGISRGAIATTMSPALLNMMVMGVDDQAMAVCANRAQALGGGLVAAVGAEVVAEVPLPILGFASDQPFEKLLDQVRAFETARDAELGSDFKGFLTTSGFTMMGISLEGLRITDRGLVRVGPGSQEGVDLVVTRIEGGVAQPSSSSGTPQ